MSKEKLEELIGDVSKVETDLYNEAKAKSENIDNRYEKGLIGKNGESILIKENGDIDFASSLISQYKLTKSGYATEISIQSNTITNRMEKTNEEKTVLAIIGATIGVLANALLVIKVSIVEYTNIYR